MRSDHELVPGGFTKEQADKAETIEAATTSRNARRRVTDGCQVYWPAPYEVCGAIRDKYNELGGPNSFLLYPTSNELTNPDGVGKRSTFQNGPIYWSSEGGAHPVVNHFFAAWQRNGWEAGRLGYPTSDEIVNPDNVGRRQYFQGGTIYWKLNEAYYVAGAIRDKWGETGWEGGFLGYPMSDETGTPDGIGRFNRFEHGVIYWTGAYGTHPVSGGLLDKWAKSGYEKGPYGYPTADQYQRGTAWYQDFQFGTMGWPIDPVATTVPTEPTVDGRPNTDQDFAVDAAQGTHNDPVFSGRAYTEDPCNKDTPCTGPSVASKAAPPRGEDLSPRDNGPDVFIPDWCLKGPGDGTWGVGTQEGVHYLEQFLQRVRLQNPRDAREHPVPRANRRPVLTSHR
ncbi:LGFP repeat-containing protein [Nocardia pseudobrasiliensis]|uniref:LGFP repeat-containing protein n=2 Tax=Nocardia pseudobrasiliensis TaxID=45979 RepID=A0A370IFC1_9NOCA|nr:LGFP repeat-containing protein [Nocardia pseudobrasiliensis]